MTNSQDFHLLKLSHIREAGQMLPSCKLSLARTFTIQAQPSTLFSLASAFPHPAVFAVDSNSTKSSLFNLTAFPAADEQGSAFSFLSPVRLTISGGISSVPDFPISDVRFDPPSNRLFVLSLDSIRCFKPIGSSSNFNQVAEWQLAGEFQLALEGKKFKAKKILEVLSSPIEGNAADSQREVCLTLLSEGCIERLIGTVNLIGTTDQVHMID